MEPFFLILIALCITAIRLFFWWFFYQKVGNSSFPKAEVSEPQKVSIIVCAKDESTNLKEIIPLLLAQKIEKEVIIVDDYSIDDTKEVVSQYPKVIYLHATSDTKGKKSALTDGINAASNNIILLTDADCRPQSNWAQEMTQAIIGYDVVIGYSPTIAQGKSIAHQLSRYESISIALQYFGFLLRGIPYMGVGRSMAYRKSVFLESGGFTGHQDLISGDDDLFIQGLSHHIKISGNYSSPVWTKPPHSLQHYINQKTRHISTASHYKTIHQLLLGLQNVSHIMWYVVLLVMILFGLYYQAGAIYICFMFTSTSLQYKAFGLLEGDDVRTRLPLFDLGLAVLYISIVINKLTTKEEKW